MPEFIPSHTHPKHFVHNTMKIQNQNHQTPKVSYFSLPAVWGVAKSILFLNNTIRSIQNIIPWPKAEVPKRPKTSKGIILKIPPKFPRMSHETDNREMIYLVLISVSSAKTRNKFRTMTTAVWLSSYTYQHYRSTTVLLLLTFSHKQYNQPLLFWRPQRLRTTVSGATAHKNDLPHHVHVTYT